MQDNCFGSTRVIPRRTSTFFFNLLGIREGLFSGLLTGHDPTRRGYETCRGLGRIGSGGLLISMVGLGRVRRLSNLTGWVGLPGPGSTREKCPDSLNPWLFWLTGQTVKLSSTCAVCQVCSVTERNTVGTLPRLKNIQDRNIRGLRVKNGQIGTSCHTKTHALPAADESSA